MPKILYGDPNQPKDEILYSEQPKDEIEIEHEMDGFELKEHGFKQIDEIEIEHEMHQELDGFELRNDQFYRVTITNEFNQLDFLREPIFSIQNEPKITQNEPKMALKWP